MSQARFFGLDGDDDRMASNANNTHNNNNQLQLSKRDKHLVDDLCGMEARERIREVVKEGSKRWEKKKAVQVIGESTGEEREDNIGYIEPSP